MRQNDELEVALFAVGWWKFDEKGLPQDGILSLRKDRTATSRFGSWTSRPAKPCAFSVTS